MELSKKDLEIYEKINLYKRHYTLSVQNNYESTFENYSNEKVIEIVKELGYTAKYRKKENFFQIIETINEMRFYFHFSLKYGLVEIIMGMMDKNKKNIIGGLVPNICKKIEIVKNEEKKGDIKKARFRNYEDLKTEVLKVDWEQ